MSYEPQVWQDGPGGGTPISAARLNHLEQGVAGISQAQDTGWRLVQLDGSAEMPWGGALLVRRVGSSVHLAAATTHNALEPVYGATEEPVWVTPHGFRPSNGTQVDLTSDLVVARLDGESLEPGLYAPDVEGRVLLGGSWLADDPFPDEVDWPGVPFDQPDGGDDGGGGAPA